MIEAVICIVHSPFLHQLPVLYASTLLLSEAILCHGVSQPFSEDILPDWCAVAFLDTSQQLFIQVVHIWVARSINPDLVENSNFNIPMSCFCIYPPLMQLAVGMVLLYSVCSPSLCLLLSQERNSGLEHRKTQSIISHGLPSSCWESQAKMSNTNWTLLTSHYPCNICSRSKAAV